MSYKLAYTLTYLIGIYFSYYLNCRLVFREAAQWSSAIKYPLVYAVQYILGFMLLYGLVDFWNLSESIAPLIVIAATVPVTFMLSRWVIKR
jgi:putative flippase GtrA